MSNFKTLNFFQMKLERTLRYVAEKYKYPSDAQTYSFILRISQHSLCDVQTSRHNL